MKKIFAVMILISTFSSMVLSFAIFNRQNSFEAKLGTLSDKQNSLESKFEVLSDKVEVLSDKVEVLSKKVDEIASDVKVLSVRMDRLETRVEKLEEKGETHLGLILTALVVGIGWLTLAFTVSPIRETAKSSVTIEDIQNIAQRLIDENNAKRNLSPKS